MTIVCSAHTIDLSEMFNSVYLNILILTHEFEVGKFKKILIAKVFGYYSRVRDASAYRFASNGQMANGIFFESNSQTASYCPNV
jgi:hypothetical protein